MISFKDIYTLPLVMEEVGGKVIDAKGQWVLDFTLWDKAKQRLLLEVINGVKTTKELLEIWKNQHTTRLYYA